MILLWTTIVIQVIHQCYSQQSASCTFNSLCTCSDDQHDSSTRTIHSISCLSVPFYKFPNLPEGSNVGQLEVAGTRTTSLESESLAGCQVQALILANNRLQHVSERAFSSLWKSLSSLDLSYNRLDGVPFAALKELRSLQWINLHGNQISSIQGDWSHTKNTVTTLFLGENDLTEIPNATEHSSHGLHQFKSLSWLNLDGNRIFSIRKHSLPLSLETVSMSHNLIETFPLDLIATLPNLRWLYLRGNHIKAVAQHTFVRKLWLEKIDLAENFLVDLPKRLFNDSVYLRDLNLAFNDFAVLRDNSFTGLQCARIMLNYNELESIEDRAFEGIEEALEYLDFDHNNFHKFPSAISKLKSLKYLYLSSNSLSEIPFDALDLSSSSLKAISLSGNRLSSIPSNTFRNCTKISHFNIAFNEINDIEENDFSEWGANIKSLILGNNRITALKNGIFSDLRELKELSLSFNPLRLIEPEVFIGLQNLESLEISFGLDRDDLPYEIFKPLTNLKWLSVDNNNLNVIDENSFDSLVEMTYLNLESNKIQILPSGLFKPSIHKALTDLRLSHNLLSTVLPGTLDSLQSLETVILSNNFLTTLPSKAFNDLPSIKRIVLCDNQLNKIDHNAFSNLPLLQRIDFQNNLLTEFSLNIFSNLSTPLQLNFSRNEIKVCESVNKVIQVDVIDFRYNKFHRVPKCLENISLTKRLYLDFNIVEDLEHNIFSHQTSLEELTLSDNRIRIISKRAFNGLQNLQLLDLSSNFIDQLHFSQFTNMPNLRILNLSKNNINYLPKDIFDNTRIELLDLSYNLFSVVPTSCLSNVGLTLRHLYLKSNNIEHIDSTTFPDIPYLLNLDLSSNKLTILPDNVFTSLGFLQSLDISSNPLRANFKELFHYAQSLKQLSLSDIGLTTMPHLPLPNLVHLNLSHNHIRWTNKNCVLELSKLKLLDLSYNDLTEIPTQLWSCLSSLKTLDVSYNPIKEIVADNFYGLGNLQHLILLGLKELKRFESKALTQIKILTSLTIETWPKTEKFDEEFCNLLLNTPQLRILKITFQESSLTKQLMCVHNKKIRHLEITGKALKNIDKDAFVKFKRNADLTLRITGTEVEELPPGLFSNMYKISYLTLDLRNNLLTYLSPEIFYGNYTTWKNVGTTLISGGITISNNPFKCGCHLAWLGHWLRRWTRESLQSHNAPVEAAMRMNEIIKEAQCIDSKTGNRLPIVQLPPEDMSCQASALSSAPNSNIFSVMYFVISSIFIVCSC